MESSRIFVRGLPPSLSADEFRIHFSAQSTPTDAKLIPNRRIGYIGYRSPGDAAKAVKYYNKSFIHMSRIGVELARSFGPQTVLRPGVNATIDLKRNYGRFNDNTSGKTPSDASNENGNPKLQEYLKIMRPYSKSRGWEEEKAVASPDASEKNISMVHGDNTTNIQIADGEPRAKRQKKHTENTQKTQQVDSSSPPDKDLNESNRKESVAKEEATTRVTDTTRVESDADWLRSRTNRLLGLIDVDDEKQERTALMDDNESQAATRRTSPEPIDTSNVSDQEAQKPAGEGTVTPCIGTPNTAEINGRLFIRNLTYTTTEDDLRQLLETEEYGIVEEVSQESNVSNVSYLPKKTFMMNILIGTAYAMHVMSTGRVF